MLRSSPRVAARPHGKASAADATWAADGPQAIVSFVAGLELKQELVAVDESRY